MILMTHNTQKVLFPQFQEQGRVSQPAFSKELQPGLPGARAPAWALMGFLASELAGSRPRLEPVAFGDVFSVAVSWFWEKGQGVLMRWGLSGWA